jgi:excisionase family DNA binding protein
MTNRAYPESAHTASKPQVANDSALTSSGLPNRLMTAFEVAEFVGCHEETIRRAYLRGLLTSQRFGVRGRRFHPADVRDWIKRGAPARPVLGEDRRIAGIELLLDSEGSVERRADVCSQTVPKQRVQEEPTLRPPLVA